MIGNQLLDQNIMAKSYGQFPTIPGVPGHNGLHGYISHNEKIGGVTFGQTIGSMLSKANESMGVGEKLTIEAVNTGNVDIHEVMIAMGKADVSFKLITAVTQKVVGAFDKLTSMQV